MLGTEHVIRRNGTHGPIRNCGISLLSLKEATLGLSEAKKKELEAKNFHKLFHHNKHHAKWVAIVQKAYAYAKDNITDGEEPRPDDVADALLPILNKDDDLRDHQRDNRASSKKYKIAFADYIVDQVLIEPTRRKKGNGAGRQRQANGN